MVIMLWDLDWYFSKDKTNMINMDVMQVSSYHKQQNHSVYMVLSKFDIKRNWDYMYIFKNNKEVPLPPLSFMLDNQRKIRKIGAAWNDPFELSQIVAACRPDYFIYPNMLKYTATPYEKSEFWRFLDNNGNFIQLIQDASRKEKGNFVVIADSKLWEKDVEIILKVLEKGRLLNKNVSFLEPISIEKLTSDKRLTNKFFELKFMNKNNIRFCDITKYNVKKFVQFYIDFKKLYKTVVFEPIEIDAAKNIDDCIEIVTECFKNNIPIRIISSQKTLLLQTLCDFSESKNKSWLEYITEKFHRVNNHLAKIKLWLTPSKWNSNFRILLSQTYKNKTFCCLRPNGTSLDEKDIPWNEFLKTFKYEI